MVAPGALRRGNLREGTMKEVIGTLTQGLFILFLITFLAWRMYRSWRRTTEYVDAMQEEERQQRASFARMPWDPHFMRLEAYLDSRYRTTFEVPADPSTFRIHYAIFADRMGQATWPGLPARCLTAYLKGKQGKLLVSLDLETGRIQETRAGLFGWGMVPVWAQ